MQTASLSMSQPLGNSMIAHNKENCSVRRGSSRLLQKVTCAEEGNHTKELALKNVIACAIDKNADSQKLSRPRLKQLEDFLSLVIEKKQKAMNHYEGQLKDDVRREVMLLCALAASTHTVMHGNQEEAKGALNLLQFFSKDASPLAHDDYKMELKSLLDLWGIKEEVCKSTCQKFFKAMKSLIVIGAPFFLGSLLSYVTSTFGSRDSFNALLEANGMTWTEFHETYYEEMRWLFEFTDYMSTITCLVGIFLFENVGEPIVNTLQKASEYLPRTLCGFNSVQASGAVQMKKICPQRLQKLASKCGETIQPVFDALYKLIGPIDKKKMAQDILSTVILLTFFSISLHLFLFVRMGLQLDAATSVGEILSTAFSTEAGWEHFKNIILKVICEDVIFLLMLNFVVTKGIKSFRRAIHNRAYKPAFNDPVLEKVMNGEDLTAEESEKVTSLMEGAGETFMNKRMSKALQYSIEALGITLVAGALFLAWGATASSVIDLMRQSGSVSFDEWVKYVDNMKMPLLYLGLSYGAAKVSSYVNELVVHNASRLPKLISFTRYPHMQRV